MCKNAGLYNYHFSGITFAPLIVTTRTENLQQTYNHEFQDLNDLIDDNQDYQLIDQQMKNDMTSSTPTIIANPQKANIIIRKQQTKADLAKFLHAACFVLVKTTFVKADKNNHFVSWPGLDPSNYKAFGSE